MIAEIKVQLRNIEQDENKVTNLGIVVKPNFYQKTTSHEWKHTQKNIDQPYQK